MNGFSTCRLVLVLALLLPLIGCKGEVSEAEVKRRLMEFDFENIEQKAPWFKPHYKHLVALEDLYRTQWIMATHGRAYACRQLEPLLVTEKGESLKRTAAYLYGFSYELHPGARAVLLSMPQSDRLVRDALDRVHFPRDDQWAREECRIEKDLWDTLSAGEKWQRLKATWVMTGAWSED